MRGTRLADDLQRVAEIVEDVRRRGDEALLEWSEELDGARPPELRVPPQALAGAELVCEALTAVRALAASVAAVHARERPPDAALETAPGIRVERRFAPLDSIGVYVPGGRAPLASSLVMAVVPAQVAGVRRIAVATPRPSEGILATARELGVDEIYAVGGAQAIAALAYGTETILRVDKIFGPGNRWVAAAKLLVSGDVAIDLAAGPSEVMIVADDSADPALCAADLLAQAEHGAGTEAVLVTTSERVAAAVATRVDGEVRIERVGSLDEALARVNDYAPEHLELLVANPESALPRVRNAGTVFVGAAAPAVIGDYASGANHVLPTGGLARGTGGLGLEAFLKPVQIVRATPEGLAGVRATVAAFAELEGLPLHAASVEARFSPVR